MNVYALLSTTVNLLVMAARPAWKQVWAQICTRRLSEASLEGSRVGVLSAKHMVLAETGHRSPAHHRLPKDQEKVLSPSPH